MPSANPKTTASWIVPLPWGDADEFWHSTAEGVLRLPRCPDTGRFIFPPTHTSPWGSHRVPEWVPVEGRGTIWSFIVAHPPLVGQFAELAPYVSAVVELDDAPGARLVGLVVASPGAPAGSVSAAEVYIGAPVQIDLTSEEGEGPVVPRWVLLPGTRCPDGTSDDAVSQSRVRT
jgi:hypothetical protein